MPPMKHTAIADSVKAAAIAAGARVGSSTEASSVIEVAHSQNVACLKAAAGFVMRRYRASTYRLPREVHFFRGGLAKAPSSSYFAPVHSQAQLGDQPKPVGGARILSVSSEKTNSTANIPSVELTKYAEGAAGSTSGSGMSDLVQKDHIHHQFDSPISAPVEQGPRNQSSESGESCYPASISSDDPGNDTLDAHVALQISEDEELGDEGVEATSSNSIATTDKQTIFGEVEEETYQSYNKRG